MRKVLLVIDDFNELVGLEKLFRRLGFDVLSLGRDATVQEVVLYFPPDLCIASYKGRNVDGSKLRPKLKKSNSDVKLVVLVPQGMTLVEAEVSGAEIDAVIETPFDPESALQLVCRFLKLNADDVLAKYQKIISAKAFQPSELRMVKSQSKADATSIQVTGKVSRDQSSSLAKGAATEASKRRESRYAKALELATDMTLPPIADTEALRSGRRQLALDSMKERARLDELDLQKRKFFETMAKEAAATTIKKISESTGEPDPNT